MAKPGASSSSGVVMGDSLAARLDRVQRKNLSIRALDGESVGKKLSAEQADALNRAFARVVLRAFEIAGWTKDRGAQELGYANATPISKWAAGEPVPMGRVWSCELLRRALLLAMAEEVQGVNVRTTLDISFGVAR